MRTLNLAALALTVLSAQAQTVTNPAWFAPNDQAKQMLTESLASAQTGHRRLVVLYEGAWCNLCAEVYDKLKGDPDLPNLIHSNNATAHVAVEDFAGLQQFAKSQRAALSKDNPLLISILEPDGTLVKNLTTPSLTDGGHVSLAKFKTAFSEFVLGPPAEDVLQKSLASLPSGKLGWVEFRADWCGWCKKMEKFFHDSEASPIMAKYFTVVAVDTEKNRGSEALSKRLGSPQGVDGIPWFAVMDSKGKVLSTSEGAKGNIGFPAKDDEFTHFYAMLKATAPALTAEELKIIDSALKAK